MIQFICHQSFRKTTTTGLNQKALRRRRSRRQPKTADDSRSASAVYPTKSALQAMNSEVKAARHSAQELN